MRKFCPQCNSVLAKDDIKGPEYACCLMCSWAGHLRDALIEPPIPALTPKMPYVSIDIETTGLDPATCQVLEVGAIIDDWKTPIYQLPEFRRVLAYKKIAGDPFALAMNAGLLRIIANPPEKDDPNQVVCCAPSVVGGDFADWLRMHNIDPTDVQAAGKNFASFDRQFLERLPDFNQYVKFRHRTLDPAMLFWRPSEDERLPSSKTCYERAGLGGKVMHTSIADARAVVQLMRVGIRYLTYVTRSEDGNAEESDQAARPLWASGEVR